MDREYAEERLVSMILFSIETFWGLVCVYQGNGVGCYW